MARLEDITAGSRVKGLAGQESVIVVSSTWRGSRALEVVYKSDLGALGSQLVFRDNEPSLEIVTRGASFGFEADPRRLKLASEAYRIFLAHLFDPFLAIHTSDIEALPHQITAVYQEMLPRQPLRFLLADDPGAGKTIMTGLLIKELMVRGDLRRCLIVTPGSLVEQWQEELFFKFHVKFEILTNDRLQSAVTGNAFEENNLCIARLDKLARDEKILAQLRATDWDLIVCDEAHKMSATVWGGEVKRTKRFDLGKILSGVTRHFLLLTATPHNGKERDFQLFMSLIDGDRFESLPRASYQSVDVSDVMRRLVKEELLKFDGTKLFPERKAETASYALSPLEARLYTEVTAYVRAEFNRADQLNGERKRTVGFALTTLQRRLASSPEAIYQSLKSRIERLKSRLDEEKLGRRGQDELFFLKERPPEDEDDCPSGELEDLEETISDQATAANTVSELEAEIATLRSLEELALQVKRSDEDSKWRELSATLRDEKRMIVGGERQKLIIFTEHRATLQYLTDKIRSLLANDSAVVNIHGGLPRDVRRKVEEVFKQDKDTFILVATDAAGEGINLQRAHLMINYDLPWNPNRLEQRFGRIHRIGQKEVCHLWNLLAEGTREGMVFQLLFDKLEKAKEALGGKVFDVLGRLTFGDKSLKDLLIEAVRYNNDVEVQERLYKVMDQATDHAALAKLVEERVLTNDVLDFQKLMSIKEEMERLEARKLQPYFVEAFFLEAFKELGGKIHPREAGRYEITHVPYFIRHHDNVVGTGAPITTRYQRVCFDKKDKQAPGLILAELICPGHPLLDAVLHQILEQNKDTLKQGAILVDNSDHSLTPRVLFYLESSVQDNVALKSGAQRVISKQFHFVEIDESQRAKDAGCAPYLNYSKAEPGEESLIRDYLASQAWLKANLEDLAIDYAIAEIIPAHVREVKDQRLKVIDKTVKEVSSRLLAAINYWDVRAYELKNEEAQGKANANLNSQKAGQRASELAGRRQKRLTELEKEKVITARPPVVMGAALIIPKGLILSRQGLRDQKELEDFGGIDRKAAEMAAMETVMAIERNLGHSPRDVHEKNLGYDLESAIENGEQAQGSVLRFIEVKGRVKGARTVTVSKNEILTGLNKQEDYILALVELDGDRKNTWYIRRPFTNRVDFMTESVNFDVAKLKTLAYKQFSS
ncbi:MAG: DUF3883 domain-containing protein [Deltaproteobacteria bacterium]|jgi:superfamily II DNA or RNA helicase|nr:DUF3883 domain-containing protein [Deltaproteobacteria bacterium]